MKYFKYILTVAILLPLVSCSLFDDPDLPIPLDETMDNTGAFLRILDVETAAFDVLNLETAAYVFTVEYFDNEGQSLLDNVEFYSNYTSVDGVEIGRTQFKTVDPSGWGTNEQTGWPSTTIDLQITEINDALGIDEANNRLGDRYQIDWVLNLTDGRSFTVDDMSPAISGGFFNSPSFTSVNVSARIEPQLFVGNYRFTQLNPASLGPVFGVPQVFGAMEFEAELSVDPNNDFNGRVFNAAYLAAFGVAPHSNSIVISLAEDTDNNSVTLPGSFNSGLGCGGPPLMMAPENEQVSQFDLDDDSEFIMALLENPEGACGGSPTLVRFQVEKL